MRKELFISAYWSPSAEENQYKWLKECGFTHVYIDTYRKDAVGGVDYDWSYRKLCFDLCEKYKIKFIISLDYVRQEYYFKSIKTCPLNLNEYKYFCGVALDEPGREVFDMAREEILYIRENYPKQHFYINMLSFENAWWAYDVRDWTEFGYANNWDEAKYRAERPNDFENYIDCFRKKLFPLIAREKNISQDMYPLKLKNGKEYFHPTWLKHLELFAHLAQEKPNMEHLSFIQSVSGKDDECPSFDDLRFQVYANMAFGVHGIQYFTYRLPGNGKNDIPSGFSEESISLVGVDNQRSGLWYYAKIINQEIQSFASEYLDYHFYGIMLFGNNENFTNVKKPLDGGELFESVANSKDLLIGALKNKKGQTALVIVNFTPPNTRQFNSVSLKFKNAKTLTVYKYGDCIKKELVDNEYKFMMFPGEGQFVVL